LVLHARLFGSRHLGNRKPRAGAANREGGLCKEREDDFLDPRGDDLGFREARCETVGAEHAIDFPDHFYRCGVLEVVCCFR